MPYIKRKSDDTGVSKQPAKNDSSDSDESDEKDLPRKQPPRNAKQQSATIYALISSKVDSANKRAKM